ncbi:hypothetical protein GCM10007977_062490 [Dactylosporangium sucinum]|uniref:Uncharacterized protein n=1 Tax=Dactylosporangium sucinum TaxID=1424081 RepID=A0A917X1J5_9ACTN|nr:hypothetical protein GCM10007977_062490 [Dactylosporangium sucinum]
MTGVQQTTALCGHDTCDPYRRRNSILDEPGDVVLYNACDGVRHVFRDGHDDGLILASTGDGWTLTRERHVEVEPGRWAMVADPEPVCTGHHVGRGRDEWIAVHHTGRTIVRTDTLYGAIARAARFYLHTTS